MPIDYAKKEAPKKTASKQNKRTPKPAPKAASGPPAWVWLITGLALGLLIAFLYHLATLPTPGVSVVDETQTTAGTHDNNNDDDTRFDFYTLLPKDEVVVDTTPNVSAAQTASYVYYLQAGSFVKTEDAETRRAELAFLGFEANVEKFSNNGSTWHRVQMGPIESRSKLASARSQLIQEGIETMVIKRKVN